MKELCVENFRGGKVFREGFKLFLGGLITYFLDGLG